MSNPRRILLVGLIAGGHSGVPRYAAALARALDGVAREYDDLRLSLLTTWRGAEAVDARELDVHAVRLPARLFSAGAGRIAAEQALLTTHRADLLHFFDLSGPLLAPRRPFVTTVHDVSVARGFHVVKHSYKRRLFPWALRRARRVVAVSQFAKDEAVRLCDADPRAVRVIHSGPGLAPPPDPWTDGQLPGPAYLLYVGNLTAKKNVPFLVSAFGRAGVDADLVLAGRPGERFGDIAAAVEASPSRDRIRLLHDAADAEIERLYAGACALVHPSRYEGFGFTPLEAMQRRCPVLASDIPAVREVSGTGAMLLPLDDEAAWADGIRCVVTDTAVREELRERGSRTVARYSWERTARALCDVFRDVA